MHKQGCSPLPTGALEPKAIANDPELRRQAGVLTGLLIEPINEWLVSGLCDLDSGKCSDVQFACAQQKGLTVGVMGACPHLPPSRPVSIPAHERLSLLRGPLLQQLLDYKVPAAFSVQSYAGRVRPHKNDFRHRLTLLRRLLLLHELIGFSAEDARQLLALLDPGHAQHGEGVALGTLLNASMQKPEDAGVRLHGPKVLAAPDKLSAGEYAKLVPFMMEWCTAKRPRHAMVWMALSQVGEQCALCPELLDYVAE